MATLPQFDVFMVVKKLGLPADKYRRGVLA
jgi:hypothetical protein